MLRDHLKEAMGFNSNTEGGFLARRRHLQALNTVVPAISVTIAASLPANAFNRLDLPALGRPAITTFIPSRNRLPWQSDLTGENVEITAQGNYPMIRLSARDGMGIELFNSIEFSFDDAVRKKINLFIRKINGRFNIDT